MTDLKTNTPNYKNFKNIRYVSKINSLFEKKRKLGKGNFGDVWEVKNKKTGKIYAQKIVGKDSLKDDKNDIKLGNLLHEMNVL